MKLGDLGFGEMGLNVTVWAAKDCFALQPTIKVVKKKL